MSEARRQAQAFSGFAAIGVIFMGVGAACLLSSRQVVYEGSARTAAMLKLDTMHQGTSLFFQVVEISTRYDDACYPGTSNDAEREALLMQVHPRATAWLASRQLSDSLCLLLADVYRQQPRRRTQTLRLRSRRLYAGPRRPSSYQNT